ncbi:MAG TPA: ABC transporter substrate-binding protein [Falsiroseomonas sp.]|jgi:peptide/nickel transport system substrate-binding protein|nr:ABC transporter substrate-binding protein [Falsiroseomonas sp.]
MRNSIRAAALAAVSAFALNATMQPAGAQQPTTLTMGVGSPVTSLDPHYHQLSPNNAVADMIFSKLVETDAQARRIPGLALEWRAIGPTVWEFKLRPGVRFHNGSDFTAEDIVATMQRLPNVPNSPSSFAVYARPIQRIEIVDPLTIRFHTASPYPLLPLDMTNVRVIDAQTHANATTEGFNSGDLAVGTGPYRVVSHRQGDRIEFEANPNYFEDAPAFQRVSYRMVTNDASRTAALLAGDLDFIDQVPTTDLQRLRNDQRLTTSETVGLRLIFLGLDHLRAPGENSPHITDNDGQPLGKNPLRDVRVRRALSMAIDRAAIASRIMEGAATPSGQFLPPGTFSHVPGLEAPAYDPDGARRLLAEAGYPNGFRIQLNSPNDRYINDSRIAQAVGQMWTRVGVRTGVEAQTWATFVGRASRQEYSTFLIGWGSNPDGSHPMRNIIGSYSRERGWGASNRGRYSNPEFDKLLAESLVELDEEKREQMLIRLQRMAAEDVAVIPLHIQTNIWAMRRGLQHTPRVDELTRAQDVRPAANR